MSARTCVSAWETTEQSLILDKSWAGKTDQKRSVTKGSCDAMNFKRRANNHPKCVVTLTKCPPSVGIFSFELCKLAIYRA